MANAVASDAGSRKRPRSKAAKAQSEAVAAGELALRWVFDKMDISPPITKKTSSSERGGGCELVALPARNACGQSCAAVAVGGTSAAASRSQSNQRQVAICPAFVLAIEDHM